MFGSLWLYIVDYDTVPILGHQMEAQCIKQRKKRMESVNHSVNK